MPEQTTIYCAYKQGYSWLAEEMLPRLKEAGADTVTVYFKPFLPEGQTEWNDENGAIPSYHNLSAETPDKWYDLPIRYLQELYPIEDLLVKELGIERKMSYSKPMREKMTSHISAGESKKTASAVRMRTRPRGRSVRI